MNMNLSDYRYGASKDLPVSLRNSIVPDERIMQAMYASGLIDNLEDSIVRALLELMSLEYINLGILSHELQTELLKDALMILVSGRINISANLGNEPISLALEEPGDMARIFSFVDSKNLFMQASINVITPSIVLLLPRTNLEASLLFQPELAYGVMKNLVRYMHGMVRRRNFENSELSNYIYRNHGRY